MKKIITLALCLYMMPSLFAQHVNYETDSKWFFGFNVGAAWNTTDVKNQTNAGWGFLFGRSFNYGYGRLTSFDLRLRYLKGTWYGQDYDTTDLTSYSPAYMPSGLQSYQNNPGYHVNNFQADVHELGLELALHANRLRERTGWDPYIFGGANITWNQTNGDLVNSDSSFFTPGQYDYDPAFLNEASINATLDGIYETPMNQGSENLDWNVNFMPSLGVGIGYYFGPRWSIGLEHKTTFALKDDWDGFEDPTPKCNLFKNDIYHYTSGYLRFHIKARGNQTVVVPPIPDPDPNPINTIAPCNEPNIRFTRPASNGITVENQLYAIRAKVDHIGGRENIVVTVNGVETTNYFFNTNTQQLEGNITLNEGLNTIQITATNACGTEVQNISINYETCMDPIVRFINPSHNNFHVDEAQYVVSASIAHGDNVTYTVNGVSSTNFFYNQSNGSFESTVRLQEGNNTIQITATNDCGTDVETITVIYTDCEDPHIEFFIGNGSVMNVTESTVLVQAYVHGIDNQNGIGFRVNGANRAFTFNASTHLLQAQVNLSPGQNLIQITSGNDCGTDIETITVNYTPCVDPSVTIVNPIANGPDNITGTAAITAALTNVSSVNQVQMYVNGVVIAGGNYNASSHTFTHNAPLNAGSNTIQIVVTNDCGSDTETVSVDYEAPCPEPTVSLATNVSQITDPNLSLQVLIQNITSANQVQMMVNGHLILGGVYHNGTHVYSSNVTLQNGANTIVVTATNDCGSETISFVVNYEEPCDLPVISMVNPVSQPVTTATPNMVVQANVSNIVSLNQIQMTVNGVVDGNGTFNSLTGLYQNGVKLQTGENVIVITATNDCGTVTQTILVNYSPCLAPSITISSPVGGTTQNGTTLIQASITNVASANNIQLVVNGSTYTGSFNSNTGVFQSSVALQQGANVIQIIATNDCGSDSEMTTVIFQPCLEPIVDIVSPTSLQTQSAQVSIQASTVNVSSASQIQMTLNGNSVSGSFNATTNMFSGNVTLSNGMNVIVITTTTECGSDSETIAIRYNEPCDDPVVSVTSPQNNLTVPAATTTVPVVATVTNISAASQVSVAVNGSPVSGGTYNASTNQFNVTVSLNAATNLIVVTASNDCGTSSSSVRVKKKSKIELPAEEKIWICHKPPGNPTNTQYIQIPISAWPAHQAHGDTQGPCPEPEEPEEPVQEEKMIICHHPPGNPSNTQQLEIPISAWPAHQAHGDTQGPCPEPEEPEEPVEEEKMTICHHPPGNPTNTQEIEIPVSAWPAHQAHGDTQGPCVEMPEEPSNGGGNNKITICHHPPGNPENTQEIEISESAWPAHEAHGDTRGPCRGNGSNVNQNGDNGNQGSNGSGTNGAGTQTVGNAGTTGGLTSGSNIGNTGTTTNQGSNGTGGSTVGTQTIGNAGGTTGGLTSGSNVGNTGTTTNQGSNGTGGSNTGTQTLGNAGGTGGVVTNPGETGGNTGGGNRTQQEEEEKVRAAQLKAQHEAKRKAAEAAKQKAEQAAKLKAQEEAKRKAAEEAKRKAEAKAKRKAEEVAKQKAEQAAKLKAQEEAKRKAAEEAKRKAEVEAKRKAEEAAKQKAEQAAKLKAQEEAKRKAAEEAKRKAEAEAKKKAEEAAKRKAAAEAKKKAAEEAKRKAEEEAKKKAEEEKKETEEIQPGRGGR
jgi:hypothetical protein